MGGRHGGTVGDEDGDARVGRAFVGVRGISSEEHASGAGVGYSLVSRWRGGSKIGLVVGRKGF